VDLAELDGNLLYESANTRDIEFPAERFEIWEWDGTDFRQESMWKDGTLRPNSIQSRAVAHYETGGFDLIFDDDAKGEAADLICFKEEEDYIRLALVHCKFTTSEEPGERLSDIVEVCSQAVRSAKWVGQFKKLCKHISGREQRLRKPERDTRFVRGNGARLNQVLRASRFKPINTEIVIVQPGLSQEQCTVEQTAVLAAAHSYLLDTVAVGLDIACSP
jgi:hypothetical protein